MNKYWELFIVFLRLGCTSFGGPVAHLAYFREEFVVKKAWLSEQRYATLVAISQTLPGPASSQVGFAIGLSRAGLWGAIFAFLAFTAPTVILLMVFASYLHWFDSELGQSFIQALSIFAFVVVTQALIGMIKQLCNTTLTSVIACVSFAILVIGHFVYSHILVILIGVLIALLLAPNQLLPERTKEPNANNKQVSIGLALLAIFALLLFGLPFVDHYFFDYSAEFYQAGSLVFGGGHVVLPLLEETIVEQNLVSQDEFLAGYGATQAMPGPMFGFAAYLGYLSSDDYSIVVGLVATIAVFLPGFLLLGAALSNLNYIDSKPYLKKGLIGANASVVGLLGATLYDPIYTHAILSNIDLAIAAIAFTLLIRIKLPVLAVLASTITMKLLCDFLF